MEFPKRLKTKVRQAIVGRIKESGLDILKLYRYKDAKHIEYRIKSDKPEDKIHAKVISLVVTLFQEHYKDFTTANKENLPLGAQLFAYSYDTTKYEDSFVPKYYYLYLPASKQ